MRRKNKPHRPRNNATADSWFKLAFSLFLLLFSSGLLLLFAISESGEGNVAVAWVVIGFFILLGLSGTYTSIQELRGKYDDFDSQKLPAWMDEDFYVAEHCYRKKVDGYYHLKPSLTPGCAARGLLIIAAMSGAIVTALMAGEQDFRDGIDNLAELVFVAVWYLIPLIFLVLGLRFYVESKLGNVTIRIAQPAVPGQELDTIICCKSRFPMTRLAVEILCQEEAKFTKGTDTETKREIIAKLPLCDIGMPKPGQSGEVCRRTFRIPLDAVPSFKSQHNQIEWLFKISRDFVFWRNVTSEIPLRVLSREMFEQEQRKWPN